MESEFEDTKKSNLLNLFRIKLKKENRFTEFEKEHICSEFNLGERLIGYKSLSDRLPKLDSKFPKYFIYMAILDKNPIVTSSVLNLCRNYIKEKHIDFLINNHLDCKPQVVTSLLLSNINLLNADQIRKLISFDSTDYMHIQDAIMGANDKLIALPRDVIEDAIKRNVPSVNDGIEMQERLLLASSCVIDDKLKLISPRKRRISI